MRVADVSSTAKAAVPRRAKICALVMSCPEKASWLCTDVRYGLKRASWTSVRCTPASSSSKPSSTYSRESIVRRAPRMASNGQVEGPHRSTNHAPRAHTVFPRPRRETVGASRTPPTIVRRHRHPTPCSCADAPFPYPHPNQREPTTLQRRCQRQPHSNTGSDEDQD